MSDSIRYEWRRTVNRDHRLTHAERRVLFELESYANPDGTNAHPGVELIAENLLTDERTPMSEKTVRRALKRAQELGYIEQTAKARRAGDVWLAAVWRLVLAADSAEASPDTQMSGHPVDNASITGHFESDHRTFSDHHRTPGCPDTSSFNTSSINTIEKISVSSADRVDSRGGEKATSLPDTWAPNRTHRKTAATANVDVDMLAAEFRVAMTREKRTDWDQTFGAFIREYLKGRSEVTFAAQADDVEVVDSTSPDPDRIAQDIARIARTGDLAAKPLTEDEREAAAWHLEQGHPWQEVAGYLEAWRENRPIVLGELGPSEMDPLTGIYNSDWCREDARQYIVRDLRDRAIDPDSLTDRELDYVTAMLNNDEGPERAADWVKRNRSPIPA